MRLSEWLQYVALPTTKGGAEQFARGAGLRAIEAQNLEAEVERLRADEIARRIAVQEAARHLDAYRAAVAEVRLLCDRPDYSGSADVVEHAPLMAILDKLPKDAP